MKPSVRIIASLTPMYNKSVHRMGDKWYNLLKKRSGKLLVYNNVVASIVKMEDEIDIESLYKTVKMLSKSTDFFLKSKFFIVEFTIHDIHEVCLINSPYLQYYRLNIFIFIEQLARRRRGALVLGKLTLRILGHMRFMFEKEGSKYYSLKESRTTNLDFVDNNMILIFHNISWRNVMFLFRTFNISFYGGNNSKRHLLSTVQLSLSKFLMLLRNMFVDPTIIRNSLKDGFARDIRYDKISGDDYFLTDSNIEDDDHFNNFNLELYSVLSLTKFFALLDRFDERFYELESSIKDEESNILELNQKVDGVDEDLRMRKIALALKKIEDVRGVMAEDHELGMYFNCVEGIRERAYELYKFKGTIHFLENGSLMMDPRLRIVGGFKDSEGLEPIDKENFVFRGYVYNKLLNIKGISIKDGLHSVSIDKSFRHSGSSRNYSTRAVEGSFTHKSDSVLGPFREDDKKNLNISSLLYSDILKSILDKNGNDLVKSQTELEDYLIKFMLVKLGETDNIIRHNLSYIIRIASETLKLRLTTLAIRKKFQFIYIYLNSSHLLIAFSVIFMFYGRFGFTSIAYLITRNILWDIYVKEFKEKDIPKSFLDFELEMDMNNNIHSLNLGSFFIEIFCHHPTKVFDKKVSTLGMSEEDVDEKRMSVLDINLEYKDDLKKGKPVLPTALPMICRPNIWSDSDYGGYLSNEYLKESVITGNSFHDHIIGNKDKLYNAVNYLSRIKFRINSCLLTFLENDGKQILDFYLGQINNRSKALQVEITLDIAKCYRNINVPFYIPTKADWRGRIYTESFFITYQGSDLSTSLLHYYEGFRVTDSGMNYLYVYGANCYNEDSISKKNFKTRIEWVVKNLTKIINLDIEFILGAESIFTFTAFCLAVRNIEEDRNVLIHLPIYLDATCSGIQHLAGMLNDFETGKKVNLVSQSDQDNVGDIYSDLLFPINQAIQKYGEANIKYESFKCIELKRKHVKRPIMTKNYNVSGMGIANQLRKEFDIVDSSSEELEYRVPAKDGTFVNIKDKSMFVLAYVLNNQIFESLPSLKSLYAYFNGLSSFIGKLDISCVWFPPSGLELEQHYNVSEQQKVSIRFGKVNNSVFLRKKTAKLNKIKQRLAFIPNLIHSLDASHLINLIHTAGRDNFDQILTIHDCFGSHPNDMEKLTFLVKKEFILLYGESNFLIMFHKSLLQMLKDKNINLLKNHKGLYCVKVLKNNKKEKVYFPELPQLGTLDIEKIIESKHFIT